jgi:Transmembrane secretion effector
MTAAVRGVIAAATAPGSMQKVAGSMSANTGVARARAATPAVAAKEKEGTITSSPGPMPRARRDSHRAAVPELTATQCRPATSPANSASNSATCRPCTTCPERRTSVAAVISFSPSSGHATGITAGSLGAAVRENCSRQAGRALQGVGEGPAVLQVGGGADGQRAGAGPDPACHVRRQQAVPLGRGGQRPAGQLVVLQADFPVEAAVQPTSLTWGILFLTNTLTVWNACILPILHGMAGALWAPPEQLLLEDFVGIKDLPSAIRLNSTARSLGILAGPVVGSALLLGLGPVHGIWVNIAFYLPLTILMARTKFTGHTRTGIVARQRAPAGSGWVHRRAVRRGGGAAHRPRPVVGRARRLRGAPRRLPGGGGPARPTRERVGS